MRHSLITNTCLSPSVFLQDPDLPESNNMHLYIIEGNEDQMFHIDNDGSLYLLAFKAEAVPDRKNLTVMVSDGKFHSTTLVKVNLVLSVLCDIVN